MNVPPASEDPCAREVRAFPETSAAHAADPAQLEPGLTPAGPGLSLLFTPSVPHLAVLSPGSWLSQACFLVETGPGHSSCLSQGSGPAWCEGTTLHTLSEWGCGVAGLAGAPGTADTVPPFLFSLSPWLLWTQLCPAVSPLCAQQWALPPRQRPLRVPPGVLWSPLQPRYCLGQGGDRVGDGGPREGSSWKGYAVNAAPFKDRAPPRVTEEQVTCISHIS